MRPPSIHDFLSRMPPDEARAPTGIRRVHDLSRPAARVVPRLVHALDMAHPRARVAADERGLVRDDARGGVVLRRAERAVAARAAERGRRGARVGERGVRSGEVDPERGEDGEEVAEDVRGWEDPTCRWVHGGGDEVREGGEVAAQAGEAEEVDGGGWGAGDGGRGCRGGVGGTVREIDWGGEGGPGARCVCVILV